MVLELESAVVTLMAKLGTIFTDPLNVTVFATVKVSASVFVPVVSETVGVYLDGNALYFDLFATESADFVVEVGHLAVYQKPIRNAALDSGIHLGAHIFQEGEDRSERSDGSYF